MFPSVGGLGNASSESLLSRVSALALGVVNAGVRFLDAGPDDAVLVIAEDGSDPIAKSGNGSCGALLSGCCGSS